MLRRTVLKSFSSLSLLSILPDLPSSPILPKLPDKEKIAVIFYYAIDLCNRGSVEIETPICSSARILFLNRNGGSRNPKTVGSFKFDKNYINTPYRIKNISCEYAIYWHCNSSLYSANKFRLLLPSQSIIIKPEIFSEYAHYLNLELFT